VYWCDQQTCQRSGCGLQQKRSSMSWLNAQVYVDLTCYMLIDIEHVTFWDTNTSQGSVATCLSGDDLFSNLFTANLLENSPVEEFFLNT